MQDIAIPFGIKMELQIIVPQDRQQSSFLLFRQLCYFKHKHSFFIGYFYIYFLNPDYCISNFKGILSQIKNFAVRILILKRYDPTEGQWEFYLFISLVILWMSYILGTPLELIYYVIKLRSFSLRFLTQIQPTSIISIRAFLLTSC